MSDPRIEVDLVRALYGQTLRSIMPGIVGGGVMFAALWATSNGPALLAWYVLLLANCAARYALHRRFAAVKDLDPVGAKTWARRFAWSTLGNGLFFGCLAIFFFPPDDLPRQMLIVLMIGAACTAGTAVAYYPPAMIVFFTGLLAPVFARFLWFDGGDNVFVTLGVVFLFAVVLNFGLGQARGMRELIATRRRNLDLIEDLERKGELARAAQQQAERANVAKSQFFAAASHDLRQPLHALGLFAASLRGGTSDPQQAHRVDQILSSVDALESLFDELLDISKLDAGAVKVARSHFRVETLFARLAAVHAPAAARVGLELRFARTAAVVESDAVLLERLVGNLVSNAIRYTERGGVLVGCRRSGTAWAVEVWDTGVGIPGAERERVFDEFYQLNNPERDRRKGLGLGLATVKRIAAVLGHDVELRSRPGRGSVFRVLVPAGEAARIPPSVAVPRAEAFDSLAGRVVAVVEDDAIVREGMRELLREWNCVVVDGASPAEVLRSLSRAPDLIVADYRLREGRNGIQVVAEMRRALGADTPAVLISGDTAAEIFSAAQAAGLVLLQKPVQPARLRATLSRLIVRGRVARESVAASR
jgi:signal transduction histidine kinase/CheY-like chemotaxis protein